MAYFVKSCLETVVLYCQVLIIITFYIASQSLIQYKLNVTGVSNMSKVSS